jgi:hypothetical protein
LGIHMTVCVRGGHDVFLSPWDQCSKHPVQESEEIGENTRDDRLRSQSEIDAAHHTIRDHVIVSVSNNLI